jgi:threonine/homoserine/homoserine lactone efflux protein
VATVLEANAFAFTALKLVGGAYLTYLGIRTLVSLRKQKRDTTNEVKISENSLAVLGRIRSPYLQGLFSDILNSKTAIVFTSLMLQFITPGPLVWIESAELGCIFAFMALG